MKRRPKRVKPPFKGWQVKMGALTGKDRWIAPDGTEYRQVSKKAIPDLILLSTYGEVWLKKVKIRRQA